MRAGISFTLSSRNRQHLEAVVADRNAPQKHVWRARIILLKERFMLEGVDGLLRDKTRPPGTASVPNDLAAEVVRLTLALPAHEATHWTPHGKDGQLGRVHHPESLEGARPRAASLAVLQALERPRLCG